MTEVAYLYDGSWEGLLSLIFESFERKELPSDIMSVDGNSSLFSFNRTIFSDEKKAKRVLDKLEKCSRLAAKRIYYAFLSEEEGREKLILEIVRLLLRNPKEVEKNYANPFVLKLKQIEKKMNREIHRMHAFVRFQKAKDDIWYAFIKPDFNVLPLIGTHFTDRYADQKWVIFDLKRNYGLYYDLASLNFIEVNFLEKIKDGKLAAEAKSEDELFYQQLWKQYFSSANINERNNAKLHLRHIPKRYWALLTEKNL